MSLNELIGELSLRIMIPFYKHHPGKENMKMDTFKSKVIVVA